MRRRRADDARVIGFRPTVVQRLSPMVGGLIGIAAFQLAVWVKDGVLDANVSVKMMVGLVVVGCAQCLLPGTAFGVVLTPWAVEVDNLRRRTIPWSQIQVVRVERTLGTRTVVLYETSGRRTRLHVPATGFLFWDKRFEEKFHTIGRRWLDHRMVDQAPPPVPHPGDDGGEAVRRPLSAA